MSQMKIPAQRLVDFVRAILAREADTGFERIHRVPSTYTWRCLDYLLASGKPQQERLFDAIAERAPFLLGLEPPPAKWADPALARFYEEVVQLPSQHIPARLLRGMLASMRTDGPEGLFAKLPEAVIRQGDSIRTTTATEIRKVVKREFNDHFGATPENQGAGNWKYQGQFSGRPFSVLIDYGGQVDQLRYFLGFSDPSTGINTRTLTYEGLLGLGFGRWDFVTADSQLENVQLLRELIQELVVIPDFIIASGTA